MLIPSGPRQALPAAIVATRIVAVLRARTSAHLEAVAVALLEAGITCIEVTLSTPGALTIIPRLREVLGDSAEIGAGSVLTPTDLEAAIESGATYTVAPCLDLEVLARARQLGVPHIPGAATPTEVVTAWTAGAPAVKVFPAAQFGGPAYIRALRDPLPEVLLVPTGGVTDSELVNYLAAGAVAVGIGSPLIGDALTNGIDEAFRARVTVFLSRLQDWKQTSDE